MPKAVFRTAEALRLAWVTKDTTVRLQLHQWSQAGQILRLKRGIYAFPDRVLEQSEAARALYAPAYISLESALHFHGLIPDVVFAMTLVTPKTTRRFKTPLGQFIYRHIQPKLFFGFDPDTLMAEKEKAVADFFYLESGRLSLTPDCFNELRWQNLENLDFKKLAGYGKKTGVKKVEALIAFLKNHGKT
ncbi:MAG: hypothetical protein HYS22_01130 [Deltaproteobacteria bacterium]|nr:hypothetical protein [Deltaproteobacteria bacterium]